ncbi:hypothetical protein JCM17380_53150 [Desulfosporosinus burensis]
MRKILLLLLPFMFLLTVDVSGSKAAFSLNQVRSLPTLGKSYTSPINSSIKLQPDETKETTPDLRFAEHQ